MYVTVEPCAMCAGAVIQSRLDTVIFGATDSKAGAAGSVLNVLQNNTLNHQCEVVGDILSNECAQLMQKFFEGKRNINFVAGFAESETTRIIRILIQYHDRPAGNLWRGTEVDITARTRNPLGAQAPRGFESHLLRHTVKPGDAPA